MEKLTTLNGSIMENEESFTINYSNIVSEKSLLSVTRMLAADMTKNPYVTVGDFLKHMSDGDLEHLMDIIDAGEEHKNFEDLMLLAAMLSEGEGLPCKSIDDYQKCTNMFMTYLAIESLYRKGLIKVHHENISFGDDMSHKCIAEKLDD